MERGAYVYITTVASIAVAVIWWTWRILEWVWVRPKKLEKHLKKQGFHGNSYRLFFGDIKDFLSTSAEAKSTPITLSDDIVPRTFPYNSLIVNNYGKKSFVWFGPIPLVHIMDPDVIKEIFNKNFKFPKPPTNPLFRLFMDGLPTNNGDKWIKHRKLLNPAFHTEKLKCMLPALYFCCSDMTRKWQEMMLERDSCELDVWPFLETLTSDVISRTAFGSSYEEGRRVFELQLEQSELAIRALRSVYVPGFKFVPTKRNQRMKQINKEVSFLLRGIIDKKMEMMKAGKGSADDLLGILLESNFKEVEYGDKHGGMSIQDVIEECKVFYFAGQETTAVLLCWTMVLLSIHPIWQDRARQEVLQVLGNDEPDFDNLGHLKIVTMILYEVLRLYPPVVNLVRKIREEITLGDVTLLPGMQIGLPILLIHHDSEIWGDDAKEFKPERFSEGISKATKNQVVFFPFGGGPRICIGQNFAILEAKLAIAMILRKFSFQLSPSYTHAPHAIITVKPQYGARLILHKL